MNVNIPDPHYQTTLFIIFFIVFIVVTARKSSSPHELSHSFTTELKGVAMLMVIFSHIGYFLFSNHEFLFPLSIVAGVGVDLFLLLSGFGLASSEIKNKKTIFEFYKKRLSTIFIPMWLVLAIILILDNYLLGRTYNLATIIESFIGIFTSIDIYSAINSPLWYFTLILFCYLIFPLLWCKKRPWLSVVAVLIAGIVISRLNLPVSPGLLKLYQLHTLAFPLGMFLAWLNEKSLAVKAKNSLNKIFSRSLVRIVFRYLFIGLLTFLFSYTAIHSGVDKGVMTAQLTSLVTALSLVFIFLLKDFQFGFFTLIGKYSYEIYLIHWPLMYRFDFIYKYTPAFLGTLLYLAAFIIIGLVLNRVAKIFIKSES